MSYQGGPAPGNGYWAGQDPPNAYKHGRPQVSNNASAQYEQPLSGNGQSWTQNGQTSYGVNPMYTSNGYQMPTSQAQVQQPQYISPAQLQQQAPARAQHYQHPSQLSNSRPTPNSLSKYTPIPPTPSTDSPLDTAMLLVSLAEEYFVAAHELAPAAALSMTSTNVDVYQKLIATGLGCLDTALKRVRLAPRQEANIRLRYAAVLLEETENFMEGETTLSKGITLCERNHYHDLKYAMQFLLAQFMAKKNPKAAVKALDGYISDAHAYQHFSWVYAFRFLRATHSLASGNLTDNHAAVQNLRAIAAVAEQQDDNAIFMAASLMEALAYLKTPGSDAVEQVQCQIAASQAYQADPSCCIPQLAVLTHIIDVASSIRQGNTTVMMSKLKDMQSVMDDAMKDPSWSTTSGVISVPIKRTPKSSSIISQDTRMILGIGEDGGDNLMMTFLNKKDAYSISCLLTGMVLLHKNSSDQKGFKYLAAGLEYIDERTPVKVASSLLPDLIARRRWRGLMQCYFQIYMAFCSAGLTDWAKVKDSIDKIHKTALDFEIDLAGPLECLTFYLTGAYHQGIGDFDAALRIFSNERFSISTSKSTTSSYAEQVERDIALLAALNTLWILQDKPRQDPTYNLVLMDRLEPMCVHHPNKDIETAFNLIAATVTTNPPTELYKVKAYLRAALTRAQTTGNTQFLCITLNVMCSRFFSGVVGDQAEKSAKAASVQAMKSGNVLWMSVADGMLAQCYEVQGKKVEAQMTSEQALMSAKKAFPGV
ncbi:uncharacterized protein LY89DRAFT_467811 [Mollisia scopiformis]|uniref:Cohesin loading factor n=1 Tax=Mollisia scopiformis TaxID=149040 RepID=A0A194XIJ4_MOLSC|nr:uncharacterized protein LY89DRAFT_467811 [Mollisia scopiformis]KUJ19983.1 hypothetical protein LY89DRAFT_467811 [Mollisia scopiformis]